MAGLDMTLCPQSVDSEPYLGLSAPSTSIAWHSLISFPPDYGAWSAKLFQCSLSFPSASSPSWGNVFHSDPDAVSKLTRCLADRRDILSH